MIGQGRFLALPVRTDNVLPIGPTWSRSGEQGQYQTQRLTRTL